MKTYISILRGINVSGQKKMLMKDLYDLYVNMGFTDVKTYIQSGNVVFKSDLKLTETKIAKLIEDKIELKYQFKVPVIIRTKHQLENIIQINPFKNEEMESLYVTFLSNTPNSNQLEKLENTNFLPDKFEIIDKEIYLSVTAYGSTKLSNNFFESKLKVTATTRNIKTIEQLIQLTNEIE
jgi:uncharacterized protein (DUF1697 family)